MKGLLLRHNFYLETSLNTKENLVISFIGNTWSSCYGETWFIFRPGSE